jgi:hypothetical protein
MWGRNSFDFEPLQVGPLPVINVSRLPNGTIDQRVSVGDHTNSNLMPSAAEIVRKRGEISLGGATFDDLSNQCMPYPPPFSMSITLQFLIIPRDNEVLILSLQDQGVRRVRLNQPHPAGLRPSWYGDSVGYYEGDTLVVDTVGFKVGPLSMIDRYGTPYSSGLRVTERFRLIDGVAARQATDQHEREYGRVGGPPGAVVIDRNYDKGLQVTFTVDDPEVFRMPFSATVTYQRATSEWYEYVCAENVQGYFPASPLAVPTAERPDF